MKKIIPIILVLLCFSCDRKYGIYNFDEFEKEHICILLPENSRNIVLKNNTIFYSNKNRNHLISYNIQTKQTNTIVSIDSKIWFIFPLNDTSVFYSHSTSLNYSLCNTTTGRLDYLKDIKKDVSHPYWGKNYICCAYPMAPLNMTHFNKGSIFCANTYCYTYDCSVLIQKKIPLFLIFEIDKDSHINPISFFGWYPKNHPANIYYNQGWLYHYYNSSTNQYICYTLIDNYIVLCDSMGRREKDVYFGSKFYKEYPPFGYEDLHSTSAVIYSYENFIAYSCLAYDPYREVYLRVIKLPRQPKNEEVFKEKVMDFAIIVADKDFNIKYEVFFDGTKYKCLYDNFLINKKGVLIFKETKYDTNTEVKDNATWFIFD